MDTDPPAPNIPLQRTKVCSKCDVPKPLTPEHFYRDAKKHNGFRSTCKLCVREDQKRAYHSMSTGRRQREHQIKMAWRKTPSGRAYVDRTNKEARDKRASAREARAADKCAKRSKYGARVTGTPEYKAWVSMRARCYTPSAGNYTYYGGRGIVVCNRWRDNFANFLADIGPRPGSEYGLGRLDPNGHYTLENCRWMTKSEQNVKRRPRSG